MRELVVFYLSLIIISYIIYKILCYRAESNNEKEWIDFAEKLPAVGEAVYIEWSDGKTILCRWDLEVDFNGKIYPLRWCKLVV